MIIPLVISLGGNTFSNATVPFEGTPEEAVAEGKRLLDLAWSDEAPMPDKELTDYIFNSLHGIPNSPDVWETMSPQQKQVLKCYRNAQSRKKPILKGGEEISDTGNGAFGQD